MTNNRTKIRKAIEADYGAVNSLYFETYNLYFRNIPDSYRKTPKRVLPKGTFLNMIEDEQNALVVVAEVDNKIVGFLYATIEREDDNEVARGYNRISVDEVSVLPNHARRGVGSQLLQEVEKWAKIKKISDLTVLVYDFNKNAINFYSKNGYVPYSIKMNKKL
ncbi:MAG: GNAT family N-acetyltransferase [Patescibacteria group bacterium]|jgi:GNAT superfamily N-acetyltransferase